MPHGLDPAARKYFSLVKGTPGEQEVGFVGHNIGADKPYDKFVGTETDVKLRYQPGPETVNQFTYHTHPSNEPSPLMALPSEQDLISAINGLKTGLRGMTIYSGPYFTTLVPSERARTSNISNYINAVHNGDLEGAIAILKNMGFDIETGQF